MLKEKRRDIKHWRGNLTKNFWMAHVTKDVYRPKSWHPLQGAVYKFIYYINLCINPSIHPSIHQCPSMHPSMSIHPSIHPSINVHPSIHQCASIHLFSRYLGLIFIYLEWILVPNILVAFDGFDHTYCMLNRWTRGSSFPMRLGGQRINYFSWNLFC